MGMDRKLIISHQIKEPFDHVEKGNQNSPAKKSHKSQPDKFLHSGSFQKLGLFFHRPNHNDQINSDRENRHRYHKPIKFRTHLYIYAIEFLEVKIPCPSKDNLKLSFKITFSSCLYFSELDCNQIVAFLPILPYFTFFYSIQLSL